MRNDDLTSDIAIGMTKELSLLVDDKVTALTLKSGTLPVFATPALVALMEEAAVSLLDGLLPFNYTTVGTRISITHQAATPVGMQVFAKATILEVDGRKITFSLSASDDVGIISEGVHDRFIVQTERFMEKTDKRKQSITG